MPRIDYVDYATASPEVQAAYDAQKQAAGGYVTNMKRTLLRSLPAYHALMQWYPLRDHAVAIVGLRAFTVFCHAISTENECLLCSLYFRKDLKDQGVDLQHLQLTETEQLLEQFGRQLAKHAGNVDNKLFAQLAQHFTQDEIVTLVGFAVMMAATNWVNNALQIEIDGNLR